MKQLTSDNIQRAWDKLIKTALTTTTQKSFNVTIPLQVDGETWEAYGAEVCDRDILFFCKQGTATYLVDTYGDRHTTELFDWTKDDNAV